MTFLKDDKTYTMEASYSLSIGNLFYNCTFRQWQTKNSEEVKVKSIQTGGITRPTITFFVKFFKVGGINPPKPNSLPLAMPLKNPPPPHS